MLNGLNYGHWDKISIRDQMKKFSFLNAALNEFKAYKKKWANYNFKKLTYFYFLFFLIVSQIFSHVSYDRQYFHATYVLFADEY